MFLPKDARVTILGAIRWGQLSQALRDTRFCRRVVSAIPTGDCVASDVDLYFIQVSFWLLLLNSVEPDTHGLRDWTTRRSEMNPVY
jgi:hypothetical protein